MSAPRGSLARAGCLAAAVVVAVAAVFGGGGAFVAWQRTRDARPEPYVAETPVPGEAAGGGRSGRLELDVRIAQVVIVPAPAGAPLRVDADYDPRRYALDQETSEAPDGRWTWKVRFAPVGSKLLALLGVKMGAVPPVLRIELPRDVAIALDGRIEGSHAALELGGLIVDSADFDVRSGAIDVSFLEPLAAPMDRLTIVGDRGSLEVTGLGNASPRTVLVRQHLGELDLDLRGAWVRDAVLRLDARMAGGTVWLPADAEVTGLPGRRPRAGAAGEIGRPRLEVEVVERLGRMVVIDPARRE